MGYILVNRPAVRLLSAWNTYGPTQWNLYWEFTQISDNQIQFRLKYDKNERQFI